MKTLSTGIDLKEFQRMVHATARAKGFYNVPTTFAHKIALAHSELSEALAVGRVVDPVDVKRELVAEELADCIIRIFDLSEYYNLPVIDAMLAKAEKNKTRPMLHGKLY